MSIAETIRSLGVSWIKTVNPYRVGDTLKVVKEAMTTAAGGLKVIIARAECQLERQRRVKPETAARLKAGGRVEVPRFGVDPDVCTGDKSCMRFNGCPSLTLKDNPDPLRDDPVAHVDSSCVGCGLCGEVAHAAVLCPSFYEARVVHNPGAWARGVAARRGVAADRLAPAGVMASRRPVSILIAALGGQGGGVLTEWIVGAAAHAGYPAQATSIPGVAQRTGATTYYVEVFPERVEPGAAEPVFSLYPTPGDVDVIIASELLEAGRTIEMDYASPGRTTVIASTHRLFSIAEKSAPGDGVFPREALEAAARRLARRFIGFDALGLARQHQSEVNALLLGALAASEAVPMTAADFEVAIREGGVAVERNVRGLKAGVELVAAGLPDGGRGIARAAVGRGPRRADRRARRSRARLRGPGRAGGGGVPGRAPRRAGGGRRAADRLPGSALRGALPRAGAARAGARPGPPPHRASSRGGSRCG